MTDSFLCQCLPFFCPVFLTVIYSSCRLSMFSWFRRPFSSSHTFGRSVSQDPISRLVLLGLFCYATQRQLRHRHPSTHFLGATASVSCTKQQQLHRKQTEIRPDLQVENQPQSNNVYWRRNQVKYRKLTAGAPLLTAPTPCTCTWPARSVHHTHMVQDKVGGKTISAFAADNQRRARNMIGNWSSQTEPWHSLAKLGRGQLQL